MATFASVKAKIISKIEALTDYFASGSVYQYEPEIGEVNQDPFAVIIASGNENDFASSSENRRSYGFTIRIFVERKGRGNSGAETLLQSIIDELIDDFDQDYTLGGVVLSSLAAPSKWGYILSDKEYRTAEINITARAWFDITT